MWYVEGYTPPVDITNPKPLCPTRFALPPSLILALALSLSPTLSLYPSPLSPDAGYYSTNGSSTCSKCDGGTWSKTNATSCIACLAGRWSTSGAATCPDCDAGKRSDEGVAACTNCGESCFDEKVLV